MSACLVGWRGVRAFDLLLSSWDMTTSKYSGMEEQFVRALQLDRRPMAVSYVAEPPAGVPAFEGSVPSGCSFWRLAASGQTFYTTPKDHYNCPVGSFTHNIDLPAERAGELEQTVGLMVQIGYLKMEELPGIIRLPQTPPAVVYGPLGDAPCDPATVVFIGKPSKLMLLVEAANRAGVLSKLPLLARPTCMALPASMMHGVVTSGGCIGNRVYVDVGDDELYAAVPGKDLEKVAAELETIVKAGETLAAYHRERRATLATV